jgi:hypothetical protein
MCAAMGTDNPTIITELLKAGAVIVIHLHAREAVYVIAEDVNWRDLGIWIYKQSGSTSDLNLKIVCSFRFHHAFATAIAITILLGDQNHLALVYRTPPILNLAALRAFLLKIGSEPFILWRYRYEQEKIPPFDKIAYEHFGGALWDAISEIRFLLTKVERKVSKSCSLSLIL